MENNSIKNLILTYGFFLGLSTILISVIKYTFGNHLEKNALESIVGFLVLIVFIYLPISKYKNENQGFLKLSEAFKIGLGVSTIAAILSVVYIYVFANYIEPDFANDILAIEVQNLQKANRPAEEIKKGVEMMSGYMMPMMYGGIIIMNLLIGFVISLVVGLILKKENPFLESN